jgi:bisphosphoglycerate-dependent phosphoglycerate mutase
VILIRHGQTEFNRVFSITRRDPGIRDPHLTEQGRRQVQAVARVSGTFNLARLITSPYARALETAAVIAEYLSVPITVDPLIAEPSRSLATSAHPWPSFVPGGRIWHSIISARSMVAPGGGNGGDDLASVQELPGTDGQ